MASHVFVTRPLPAPGIDLLKDSGFEVRSNPEDRPLSREELLAGVRDADALICMLSDRIDSELLDSAPALKVIANYAVGHDNIDVGAVRKRGIEVTNTPGVLTEATADLAWALLLAAARNLGAGERMVRAGEWTGWGPMQLLGEPLQGRTLGIVGMGAIGQAVARRGKGFGLEIIYFNRNRVAPEIESSLGAQFVSFDELVRRSDFVSLHAPLNEQSRHLFNQQTFQSMKSTAVLVNTGRGALIDEVELVAALQQGRIAAAGLDVYEFEPKITEGLVSLDNVVLAPHLGSASTSARGDMVRLCCENVIAVLAGKPALTPVHA
ncbi:MAG: D-glycerate dehydrogenase [Actinobacteria bacterium]|jgi:glyoxylate reductase|nr:D-glycerate dehydrogenase [Actinomycetota bacterium]MSW31758.1 D-glycerate dehydrogenase [Actinomycetota bacterium]MSX33526.1 D-glycerate dehydrogenase [Actinomycetota bacterium]MSY25102.1 D-glycerate dehydrogenase [Actinomycetota bacterium]MSZ51375.1 D-glycerate dehydrogenase [Actinomycetota bacterium]